MFTAQPAATSPAGAPESADVVLRPIEPADAGEAARVLYEAFAAIHDRHRFARDFPTLESAAQLTSAFTAHPAIWGVVAERDGRIVGSNFLDERGPIRGVGPITVDPAEQARGVGRRLMEAVIERGAGARGIRLLQDSFNAQSLALYASLGFEVAEPVVLLSGRPRTALTASVDVRPMHRGDVEESAALHRRIHGFDRTAELLDALDSPVLEPVVAVRDSRIVAYAASLTVFAAAHGVGETEQDLLALITGALASGSAPGSFLLPARQAELLRGALDAGLRIVKPMTYMTLGEHREPQGAWFPSVLY